MMKKMECTLYMDIKGDGILNIVRGIINKK